MYQQQNSINLILISGLNYYKFNGRQLQKHIVSDHKLTTGQVEHYRQDTRSFIEQMSQVA